MTDDTRGTLHQFCMFVRHRMSHSQTLSRSCTRECWNPWSNPPEQTYGSKRLNWRRPGGLPVVDKEMLTRPMKRRSRQSHLQWSG